MKFFLNILRSPLFYGVTLTVITLSLVILLSSTNFCSVDLSGNEVCITKSEAFLKASPSEMGDTVAGVAGMLAFLWIIVTVLLQRQELKAQRHELEQHRGELVESRNEIKKTNEAHAKQLFENTFFSMLEMFNRITDGIDVGTLTGRDCFSIFVDDFHQYYKEEEREIIPRLNYAYEYFWDRYQSELGHYFRSLYRIYVFISENRHAQPYHVKLLRAQLSDQELIMLFYNCLSVKGKKFKMLAEQYEIFDNLPTSGLVDFKLTSLIGKKAFGKNTMQQNRLSDIS